MLKALPTAIAERAKAAHARGQGRQDRILRAPRIGIDRVQPGRGQRLGHGAGLGGSTQKKDARHG